MSFNYHSTPYIYAMKKIIFCIGLFSVCFHTYAQTYTRADSLRGCLTPLRDAFDVTYYDLHLKIDIDSQFISGYNDIRFKALRSFSEMQLDLFENMNIDSVVFANASIKYKREGNAFFVNLPVTVHQGDIKILRVYYSGKPIAAKYPPWDGGFVWRKDNQGKPWVGVACEGIGASLWWPCKDHLSDEPDSMHIRIAVPDGLQNISNGRLQQTVKQQDGYTRWDWFVSYPINNYNVTVNIADYAHFSDIHIHENDTLTLDYYVLPQNLEKAKVHFQQVKPMMKAFEYYFGKYPFYRDGYKLIETPYLGMEHQTAIAYGNKYQPGYLGRHLPGIDFDYIIIHETGHEWWGNNVSMKDIADMWIHEGFCTYAEVLYVEFIHGKEDALRYVNSKRSGVKNKEPIIGDYEVNQEGSGDMYNKGALMLHTLRSWMNNDALFLSIIKGIQEEFAYETVTTRQIEGYMETKAGLNLKPFFNQYLRKAELPVLEYSISGKKKNATLTYQWNAVKDFDMAIRIYANGMMHWISPKEAQAQQFSLGKLNKKNGFRIDEEHFYIGLK